MSRPTYRTFTKSIKKELNTKFWMRRLQPRSARRNCVLRTTPEQTNRTWIVGSSALKRTAKFAIRRRKNAKSKCWTTNSSSGTKCIQESQLELGLLQHMALTSRRKRSTNLVGRWTRMKPEWTACSCRRSQGLSVAKALPALKYSGVQFETTFENDYVVVHNLSRGNTLSGPFSQSNSVENGWLEKLAI